MILTGERVLGEKIVVMILTGERVLWKNLSHCYFLSHKTHTDWSYGERERERESERESRRRAEAGEK